MQPLENSDNLRKNFCRNRTSPSKSKPNLTWSVPLHEHDSILLMSSIVNCKIDYLYCCPHNSIKSASKMNIYFISAKFSSVIRYCFFSASILRPVLISTSLFKLTIRASHFESFFAFWDISSAIMKLSDSWISSFLIKY